MTKNLRLSPLLCVLELSDSEKHVCDCVATMSGLEAVQSLPLDSPDEGLTNDMKINVFHSFLDSLLDSCLDSHTSTLCNITFRQGSRKL